MFHVNHNHIREYADDEFILYEPGTGYPDSASYFGKRDILIEYSDFNATFYDDPYMTIDAITETYNAIQSIKAHMNTLKSAKFRDVSLMSPRARSLDSDNHVFIEGLNL